MFISALHRREHHDWWLAGGVSPSDVLGAYQPVGAADDTAALINLNNPGTNTLTPGTPNSALWSVTTGWQFVAADSRNLVTSLTGVILGTDFAILANMADVTGSTQNYVIGTVTTAAPTTDMFLITRAPKQYAKVGDAAAVSITSAVTNTVYGVRRVSSGSTHQLWKSGSVAAEASGVTYAATSSTSLQVGCSVTNGTANNFLDGKIRAILFIQNPTNPQMVALSQAMAAI